MEQEIKEARDKLAARFGNTQIGGKGTQNHTLYSYLLYRYPKKEEEAR